MSKKNSNAGSGPKKTVYRSSKDGQFVTKRDAIKHPATTQKESVSHGKPGGSPPITKKK